MEEELTKSDEGACQQSFAEGVIITQQVESAPEEEKTDNQIAKGSCAITHLRQDHHIPGYIGNK